MKPTTVAQGSLKVPSGLPISDRSAYYIGQRLGVRTLRQQARAVKPFSFRAALTTEAPTSVQVKLTSN